MKALIALLLMMATTSALADSVYVYPAKGKGVSQSDLDTIHELMKTGVEQIDGFTLAESQEGSDFQLRTMVLKLGGAYILKAQKRKGTKKLHTTKMKAADIEDMDTVAVRVVRSALEETSAKDSAKVTEVTKEEERGTRRYQSKKQWWVGFGPASSTNLGVKGSQMQYGAGYNWDLDPDFDLQLMFDLYSASDHSDANFINFAIGINRFLSRDKHAFHVGGDLGYGAATASEGCTSGALLCDLASDDDASGWIVGASVGMRFFRTSSVNLGLVLRYNHMFDKTENTEKSPSVSSLRLVGFF